MKSLMWEGIPFSDTIIIFEAKMKDFVRQRPSLESIMDIYVLFLHFREGDTWIIIIFSQYYNMLWDSKENVLFIMWEDCAWQSVILNLIF